jgi:hypothetical protein
MLFVIHRELRNIHPFACRKRLDGLLIRAIVALKATVLVHTESCNVPISALINVFGRPFPDPRTTVGEDIVEFEEVWGMDDVPDKCASALMIC